MSQVRLNHVLREELAGIISREVALPGVLITVVYVLASVDQKAATVGVSVLPDNQAGTALAALKRSARPIAAALTKKVRLRQIPRLSFVFDSTEKEAAAMEAYLDNLE
ncbi:ribosome-binding factor A [Candidatus Falkowbacteria bacterium]|jgi:ribosome-binding factor A|nr:ribosome-binding factor A [Patescibacteria group bacterium]MDD3435038.1 ribosome-binding factor A [Patescibacteria group bacterium]MDD4466267.1 ribosome-binding factor A [Patescibacteria group bacterium]NCU43124.1 ribosome-binding factor A [Candidatus Falkowbacteria bacterium]